MKVGINILNFGPGTRPESLLQWVRFAEETGFHLAMISDHVAITPKVQTGFSTPFYDPLLSLSWLAGQTNKVELGTTVLILPYRHPLHTARLAANLDRFTHGRFILGVGVGWAQDEFEALGLSFSQRGAISNEYLEVIRLFWENEEASYQGDFISFNTVYTGPSPVRSPGPPIWVGGSSDAALRRAVSFGDCWHPYNSQMKWLIETALPRLRHIAEKERKSVPALCPRVSLRVTEEPLPESNRILGQGSLDQIHSDLTILAEMGSPYVLLDTYTGDPNQSQNPDDDWDLLGMVADQILDLDHQGLR